MAEKITGRRTLHTRMAGKDALLELLKNKEFFAITVSDFCRVADINRGTLYLRYKNVSEMGKHSRGDRPFTEARL